MGILQNLRKSQKQHGIVPTLDAMPSKYAICEDCGKEIKLEGTTTREPNTGRWMDEGEANVYPELTNPVYSHLACPEGEEW